jgi:nucleoid DNA-binding protein
MKKMSFLTYKFDEDKFFTLDTITDQLVTTTMTPDELRVVTKNADKYDFDSRYPLVETKEEAEPDNLPVKYVYRKSPCIKGKNSKAHLSRKTVGKDELIKLISESTGLFQKDVNKVVLHLFTHILENLRLNNSVSIPLFGTFTTSLRKEGTSTVPNIGTIVTHERKLPKIRWDAPISARLNNQTEPFTTHYFTDVYLATSKQTKVPKYTPYPIIKVEET